jgi:site-specific recombinase XerD
LRRSCATFLAAEGVDLRVIMEILGHGRLSVASDIYTHVMIQVTKGASHMDEVLRRGFIP